MFKNISGQVPDLYQDVTNINGHFPDLLRTEEDHGAQGDGQKDRLYHFSLVLAVVVVHCAYHIIGRSHLPQSPGLPSISGSSHSQRHNVPFGIILHKSKSPLCFSFEGM